MVKKKILISAALGGLLLASACNTTQKASSQSNSVEGECHGINSCKGKGECGGKGHSCAGKNSCKGMGWVKMTKDDCEEKGGKFKS